MTKNHVAVYYVR